MGDDLLGEYFRRLGVDTEGVGRAPAWTAQVAQVADDLHVIAEEVQLIRQALEKIHIVLEVFGKEIIRRG